MNKVSQQNTLTKVIETKPFLQILPPNANKHALLKMSYEICWRYHDLQYELREVTDELCEMWKLVISVGLRVQAKPRSLCSHQAG